MFSHNRFKFLLYSLTFHDHDTLVREYLDDRFARARRLVVMFEENAHAHYTHTPHTVIDETLVNFYGKYKCDFKVFCKDKPGKEGILLRTLADCKDRYISRVQPYAPLAPNQTQSADITHSLVMDLASDLLGTGRNLCGDRFYSSITTAEALHAQNVTYVGTIMPNRAGLPTELKSVKDRPLESSVFMWKEESPVMAVS